MFLSVFVADCVISVAGTEFEYIIWMNVCFYTCRTMAQKVSCPPLRVEGTDSILGQSVGFMVDKVALEQALGTLRYYLVKYYSTNAAQSYSSTYYS